MSTAKKVLIRNKFVPEQRSVWLQWCSSTWLLIIQQKLTLTTFSGQCIARKGQRPRPGRTIPMNRRRLATLIRRSGVTRVCVTQGGNWGCHPYFFVKNWRPFLVITVTFIGFTRVSPPWKVSHRNFLPVRPRFSTVLCKFTHQFFSFGCHPLEGVTRGGPPPPAPSNATD